MVDLTRDTGVQRRMGEMSEQKYPVMITLLYLISTFRHLVHLDESYEALISANQRFHGPPSRGHQ